MVVDEIATLAASLVAEAQARGITLTTAESCTGGMVAAAITDIAGSSAVFGTGFVTYSNEAKARWLGVPGELLERHGAVSPEVAVAMAEGARRASGADLAVAITGIAGPGGGSEVKPVGLVHFACASKVDTIHGQRHFGPLGRGAVRQASTATALAMLLATLGHLAQAGEA